MDQPGGFRWKYLPSSPQACPKAGKEISDNDARASSADLI
jgi:hypothetical protein